MEPVNADDRIFPPLFDIRAVWETLWRRRMLILGVTGSALLLAVLYVTVTKPVYTATASILVDPRDPRAVNFNNVLPGIGADSAAIASQVSVIESQDLLNAVFDGQKIAADPEFSGRGLLSKILSFGHAAKPMSRDVIFKSFQGHVGVEREGLTYVIDVSFTSHDADKAARIANAIIDRYKASLEGEKEQANSDVSSLLTGKIAGLQKSVSDAERAVQDFKFQHDIFDAAAGGTLRSQIDQLSTQLATAQDQADQALDKYNQALAAGTSPQALVRLSEILSSSATSKLRDDYNTRAAALANIETIYGPRHPAVVRLQSELAKVKGLMAAEAERITRELKANRDLAQQNVEKLQAKLGELRSQANASDLAQVQLRQLQRNADAARSVLDDFLKRAQETSQMSGLQMSQVRVISPATAPVKPAWPKPFLLLPVSVVLGFLAGCGLAFALGSDEVPALRTRPVGEPDRIREEVEPVDMEPVAVPVRETGTIANLGVFAIPVAAGTPAHAGVREIRARMFEKGNTTLSLGVVQLLKEVVGRLERNEKPYVLLVSSLREGSERALAAAMIGIGLERANESVLVVEIAAAPHRPMPLLSVSTRNDPGFFVDPASGLRTMIFRPRAHGADAGLASEIRAEAGDGFDFIVVLGRSLGERSWSPMLAEDADLVLFALAEDEAPEAEAVLYEGLPATVRSRSATVILAADENRRAEDEVAPRDFAQDADDWRGAAAAGA